MPSPREPAAASWRIVFEAPAEHCDAFAAAAAGEDGGGAVSAFETAPGGPWRVGVLVASRPERAAVEARVAIMAAALGLAPPAIDIEPVPDTDWLAATRAAFPPLRVGRFFVHGAHIAPRGPIDIEIDAGPAFGSGEHATTRGCLLAIDALARRARPARVLDMGCGSGILAIAAAKVWRAETLAVDIDARAVATTRENARRNGVAARVRARRSDGFRDPEIARRAPYDLILANILARPLIALAPGIARRLAPGGAVVLSGLIARQERMVLAAYRARGLRLARRIAVSGWHTLLLKPSRL